MITGFFDPGGPNWPIPRVRANLYLPLVAPRWASIRFVIDTGAAMTVLHPTQARDDVGIGPAWLADPDRWPRRVTAHGIGGEQVCYVVEAESGLRHERGHTQVIRDRILIAEPSSATEALPSVLGWNVLQHFRLELDWAQRSIHLL